MRLRRSLSVLVGAALIAGPILAQAIPGVPPRPTQPPQPDRPRGGGGGIGNVGLTISLGKKKKKPAQSALLQPELQMRDADIPDFVPGQLLFFIKGDAAAALRIARAGGVEVIDTSNLSEVGLTIVTAQIKAGDTVAAAVNRLKVQEGVETAQPNHVFQVLGSNSREKGMALHGIKLGGKSRVSGSIVMIDGVVDVGHAALKGAPLTQILYGSAKAPSAHGTAIAEILSGTGDFTGVASGARLVSLAAFSPVGETGWQSQSRWLAQAMNDALKLRPNVVNLSFGARLDDWVLSLMLHTMDANGVCVVAAAGNGAGKPVLFPARLPSVVAVTAVDGQKRAYSYASRGPEIDVAAWGVAMNAAVPGGRRAVSGTSFATAVVAGAALRVQGCSTSRNPAAARSLFSQFASDLGAKGADPVYGAGLLQLPAKKKN